MNKLRSSFILSLTLMMYTTMRAQPAVVHVNAEKRWNLLSVPVQLNDFRKSTLFPTAISNAFEFKQGYEARDTLENGTGYWLKFDGSQIIAFAGDTLFTDTFQVVQGWNLVGSLTSPITSENIFPDSAGLITSHFFGFDGEYFIAETIDPGYGYWVKCSRSGTLVMSLPGTPLSFHSNDPSLNVYYLDSYPSDQSVKLFWHSVSSSDVRIYYSLKSPDSGFREVTRRTESGPDSCIIDGLENDSVYYFRVATYDSAGSMTSVSKPVMTTPGLSDSLVLSLPANQKEPPEYVSNISWSHDGLKVAFLKRAGSSANVFVLTLSDSSLNQVTNFSDSDNRLMSVSWSPNDSLLSYDYTPTSTAGLVDYRIWLIPPSGGSQQYVTSGRVDAGAAWLSQTKLMFTKGTIGPPNVPEFYVVDLSDSNHETQITFDQSLYKYNPAIDSAHSTVVFDGYTGSLGRRLYLMQTTGGPTQSLGSTKYWEDIHPSFSADGQTVYFTSTRSGHFEVWSIDIQSGSPRQMTLGQERGKKHFYGRCSPDGTTMAVLEGIDWFDGASLMITTLK